MARPIMGVEPSAIIASIMVLFILGLQVQSCMALPSMGTGASPVVGASVVVATEESWGNFRYIFAMRTSSEGDFLDICLAYTGNIGHRDFPTERLSRLQSVDKMATI